MKWFLITGFLFFCLHGTSQVNITIQIKGLKNVPVSIVHHYGNQKVTKLSTDLDKTGKLVIRQNEKLPEGMYLAVLPANFFIEFLVTDDQDFVLETDTTDFINAMKVTGSEDNLLFNNYQKFMMKQKRKSIDLQVRLREHPDSSAVLEAQMDLVMEENLRAWKKLVADHPDSFIASVILAMTDPDVPPRTEKDTAKYYEFNYVKEHFWDSFRFDEERLLNTPVFYKRLDQYFTKMIRLIPDTVIAEGSRFLSKIEPYKAFYYYAADYLLNFYESKKYSNMDKVFVNFATELYMTGKVPCDSAQYSEIMTKVIALSPVMYGNKAKELKLESPNGTFFSLLETKAEYTAIFFYEPGCDYCVYETPRLKMLYDKYKQSGFEVYAVYTQADKEAWKAFVEVNNLDWVNVWDPGNTSEYRSKFQVDETPLIFLLNSKKEIIAKRIDTAALEQLLRKYLGG